MGEEKTFLNYEQAVSLLNPEGEIHTFRNPNGGMLVGMDWNRESLLKALKDAKEIEVTGPQAQAMNHGIAIKDEHGWLFIETKKSS